MSPTTNFSIRAAGLSPYDARFFVTAMDSTLPYLAATGNAGQWGGSTPFSEKEGYLEETVNDIVKSEHFRKTGTGERVRTFIAEVHDSEFTGEDDGLFRRVDDSGKTWLSVGVMTIRDEHFPDHIREVESLKSHIAAINESGEFLVIDVIVADHRVGQRRKGVGDALLNAAKLYAQENGKATLLLDCYTGGTGKLAGYYKRCGFHSVGDFALTLSAGRTWPGQLLQMNVPRQKSRDQITSLPPESSRHVSATQ